MKRILFGIGAVGLAALASAFAGVFVVIRYAGAAYLLYLAWKLWTAPPLAPQAAVMGKHETGEGSGLFLTGLAINLGNPKAIAFFLALLPSVIEFDSLGLLAFTELAAVIAVIVCGVCAAYVFLAARMRRLIASPRAIRLVNRGSGVAVAGAAVVIATR